MGNELRDLSRIRPLNKNFSIMSFSIYSVTIYYFIQSTNEHGTRNIELGT